MASTAKPLRPGPLVVWPLPLLRSYIQEMLNKHPQAAPPTLPSSSVPPPLTLSEFAVRRGVRSFRNGWLLVHLDSAQATSMRQCVVPPLTEQIWFWLPSPGLSTSWLLAVLRPPSPHTSVGPLSSPARRRTEAIAPLPLGKCCNGWYRSALPPSCANQSSLCSPLCS